LHIHNAEVLIKRATIDTHTAAGAGTELDFGETCHFNTLFNTEFAEIDKEYFREDVHISREGEQDKEGAQRYGIECPEGEFYDLGHGGVEKIANGLCQKTAIVVETCRDRLAHQTEREDEPKRGADSAIHQGVLGGAFHAENAGMYFLNEGQRDAGEHIEQQQVHDLGEDEGRVVLGRNLVEITVENSDPEVEILGRANAALNSANQNKQKPTEGDAAVHIT